MQMTALSHLQISVCALEWNMICRSKDASSFNVRKSRIYSKCILRQLKYTKSTGAVGPGMHDRTNSF